MFRRFICLMCLYASSADAESIRYCIDPAWAPIEWKDENNRPLGVSMDYLNLISRSQTLIFEFVPTSSWEESEEYLKNGQCDMVTAVTQTLRRSKNMSFTDSYLDTRAVIIAQEHVNYIDNINYLKRKKVALVKLYAVTEYVKSEYPELEVVETDTLEQALELVSTGAVTAAIGDLMVSTYLIQYHGFSNLKVAGASHFNNSIRFATAKGNRDLVAKLNQGLQEITNQQHTDILLSWYKVRFDHEFSPRQLFYIAVGILFVSGLYGYHLYRLKSYASQIEDAHLKLDDQHQELRKQSERDALTKVYNRVKLDNLLNAEIERFRRYGEPFIVMIVDIDHFKKVNDEHGHLTGDEILVSFSQLMKSQLRKVDYFGRWGGEEFLLICSHTDICMGRTVAEKLIQAVRDHHFPLSLNITCSIGITQFLKNDAEKSALTRADAALYQAKSNGRDQYIALPVD